MYVIIKEKKEFFIMKKQHHEIPDTELEVMNAIWSLPTPTSTGEIKKKLDLNRPWNLSALQTLLGRLVERGFLSVEKEKRNKKYTAIVKNDEYRVKANHTFLEKVNGNSVKNFVASLYDGNVLSKEDLKELEEFINEKLKSDN